jgi:hypothetical protein
METTRRRFLAALGAASVPLNLRAAAPPVRSVRSGLWSSPTTWASGTIPGPGSMVEIAAGHAVVYDHQTQGAIRMVHVLGTLTFARDRDTLLEVGLLKIGGDASEDGFNNASHQHSGTRPVLEVGTAEEPIPAGRTARIRLVYFEGADKESLPSLICCGGRMDLHGAPMSRTWLKLGAPAARGAAEITLAEPVTGWRVGDRILLTATTRQIKNKNTFRDSTRDNTQTEERIVRAISGAKVTLDRPLEFEHICDGLYRGDVANLSRNVVVESANPDGVRGHTMYHAGSAGAVSYAEFRNLGKQGVLGRYSLHFHKVRDSMRGTSVIGASIWNSGNRWITIHGTDYLVVRDCVGYNSIGHGFFLEDGTEVFNVLDRNLAVQARVGKALPGQVLPFDHNEGAGFWWANSLNTFTRNVACECDEYGFRFDAVKSASFDTVLAVPGPDGSLAKRDIRTLPFVRCEDNESHCQRRFALNLGGFKAPMDGGTDGVGPDAKHPFVVRNTRVWNVHWGFHTLAPNLVLDNYVIHNAEYAFWRTPKGHYEFRGLVLEQIEADKGVDASAATATLAPVDDLPPVVVVTHVGKPANGKVVVRGTASDSGPVKGIEINGRSARALRPDFAEWEVSLDAPVRELAGRAEDAAGNVSTVKVLL